MLMGQSPSLLLAPLIRWVTVWRASIRRLGRLIVAKTETGPNKSQCTWPSEWERRKCAHKNSVQETRFFLHTASQESKSVRARSGGGARGAGCLCLCVGYQSCPSAMITSYTLAYSLLSRIPGHLHTQLEIMKIVLQLRTGIGIRVARNVQFHSDHRCEIWPLRYFVKRLIWD